MEYKYILVYALYGLAFLGFITSLLKEEGRDKLLYRIEAMLLFWRQIQYNK